jgi:hypothetical protein
VCDVVNNDMAIKVASFGAYLIQLEINEKKNDGVSDIHMMKIAEGCRNIKILQISNCQAIADTSMIRIA